MSKSYHLEQQTAPTLQTPRSMAQSVLSYMNGCTNFVTTTLPLTTAIEQILLFCHHKGHKPSINDIQQLASNPGAGISLIQFSDNSQLHMHVYYSPLSRPASLTVYHLEAKTAVDSSCNLCYTIC